MQVVAKHNFTHLIQFTRRDEHQLVKAGIYRFARDSGAFLEGAASGKHFGRVAGWLRYLPYDSLAAFKWSWKQKNTMVPPRIEDLGRAW